jgi:hypothetical protein
MGKGETIRQGNGAFVVAGAQCCAPVFFARRGEKASAAAVEPRRLSDGIG